MSRGTIVYVFTEQFEKAKAFYEKALGVSGEMGGPDWCSFNLADGAEFALHRQVKQNPPDPKLFYLDFAVEDIEAAVARFQAAGATVARGIQDEAFGQTAVLRDLEGREFTVVEVGG